jgi:DNA-binding PadR family transcriptional regulator
MALSHAIMTALLEDDMSGYELAKSFDSSLALIWRASHQQIYQDLRKLQHKGYLVGRTVPQAGKPSKIVYTLTRDGRAALADWVLGESRLQEVKDDLMVKLYNLDLDNVAHIISELEHRREQIMGRLYLYERIRRSHYDKPETLSIRRKGVYLALTAGVSQGEQFLQWCDEAVRTLARLEDSP